MGQRADQRHWIEPAASGTGEERRRGSLRDSHLVASMDEAARRHPGAIAAALFCGGVVTGTWLGRGRSRRAAREQQELAEAGGVPREARGTATSAPASGLTNPTAPATRPAAVTRRRDPIGSPSVLQH